MACVKLNILYLSRYKLISACSRSHFEQWQRWGLSCCLLELSDELKNSISVEWYICMKHIVAHISSVLVMPSKYINVISLFVKSQYNCVLARQFYTSFIPKYLIYFCNCYTDITQCIKFYFLYVMYPTYSLFYYFQIIA